MPARGGGAAQRQAATIEEVRAELEAAKRDKDTKKKLSKLEGAETYRAWKAELLVLAYGMGAPIDDMIKQGLEGDASGDGNPDADNVTERRKLYPIIWDSLSERNKTIFGHNRIPLGHVEALIRETPTIKVRWQPTSAYPSRRLSFG